ncbi:hypothetical protein QFZ58_001849 [Streptomyces sp. B1I3]|nr:hypothetical protein [Streptomyces sp. B1I3]
MVDALPAAACQVGQPGAGGREQIRRLRWGCRFRCPVVVGPAGRLVDAGQQRVVDGAEQCGTGGGQGDEVVLARRPCRGLLGRFGDQGGQRGPRDSLGECGRTCGTAGAGSQQPGDEGVVEGVDDGEGVVEPVDGPGQQVGAHHATARVGGKKCISGNGVVAGASSR